jgi:hypothetical protein
MILKAGKTRGVWVIEEELAKGRGPELTKRGLAHTRGVSSRIVIIK